MIEDQYSYYEQIDEYLSGNMSSEARESFEKQIESDADLKEEVSVQKDLRDLVIGVSLQDLRTRMDHDLNESPKSTNFKKPFILLLAVLSLATIGVITYQYFSNDEFQENKTSETNRDVETKKADVFIEESSDNKELISPLDNLKNQVSKVEKSAPVSEQDVNKKEDKIISYNPIEVKDSATSKGIELINTKKKEDVLVPNKNTEDKAITPAKVPALAQLSFSGKLKAVKSEYQKHNGQIIIEGEVSGGEKPYIYLVNEKEFQNKKSITQLKPGIYKVKVVDATNKTIDLGETVVKEEICILDYNESFILSFDANWAIPVIEDMSYSFAVYSQQGMVYQHDFEIGEAAVWNGINNNSSKADLGFYRFEIIYSDGRKCLGELTIGN